MSSLDRDKEQSDIKSTFKYFALISQIGLQFIFCVLLGGFLGMKLDKFFKTIPLFSLIGLILGIIGGAFSVYRLILESEK